MKQKKHAKITRRKVMALGAGTVAGFMGAPYINKGRYTLSAFAGSKYSARAIDLVQRSLVIDMLGVLTVNGEIEKKWLRDPESFSAADIRKFRAANINVFHNAVGIGGPDAHDTVLHYVRAWNGFITNHDRVFMRIDSVSDLERILSSDLVGIMIGLQNAEHFRTVDDVDKFHGLGQRISQLTYNARNMIGSGATERIDGGLSDFGLSIIERMNKVGMGVDVSHCGDRTTLDAFAVSGKPVMITHSNCRALVPAQPRAKPDEAIKAMAKSGSIMGITNVRNFVLDHEPTTIEHVIDHYDHVVKIAGMDHVAVGTDSDLSGYDALPLKTQSDLRKYYKGSYAFRDKIDIEGLSHPRKIFDLTEGLIRRGYSDDNIEAILGLNAKRVLKEIWGA